MRTRSASGVLLASSGPTGSDGCPSGRSCRIGSYHRHAGTHDVLLRALNSSVAAVTGLCLSLGSSGGGGGGGGGGGHV